MKRASLPLHRREFIAVVGGAAAAWPCAATAQQIGPLRRIGVLMNLADNDPEAQRSLSAFRQQVQQLGWVEGRNIQFEYRWTFGSPERARVMAAELVGQKPDAILTAGGTALSTMLRETRSIPIVFVGNTDPVATGMVASLARPGGNATGFTAFEGTLGPKWLEMLKEVAPHVARVAILTSDNPASSVLLPPIEAALPTFGFQGVVARVHNATEIEQAIDSAAREANVGLLAVAGTVAFVHRYLITSLAARHRMPAIYTSAIMVQSGGLLSYGTDRVAPFRQAAGYLDRILRGEKPGDLPVQVSNKFELAINLQTARALGLTVPSTLLVRADELIE